MERLAYDEERLGHDEEWLHKEHLEGILDRLAHHTWIKLRFWKAL